MTRIISSTVLVLSVWVGSALAAVSIANTTLDASQEVPTPVGVPEGAGGTAVWTFDDSTNVLTYMITVQNLSGTPIAGHIHQAPPGTAGGIIVALPSLPPGASSSASGSVTLPSQGDVQSLFNEGLYVNLHTVENPQGEIRGQIRPVKGSCSCQSAANHGKFVSCVKKAIKALDKNERKATAIKALKRFASNASCGKKAPKKVPKNTIACCLPATPQDNIVTGRQCGQFTAKKCSSSNFLGTMSGASCFPNPCEPPASPSGAFLD
jgi:hypothetical protein